MKMEAIEAQLGKIVEVQGKGFKKEKILVLFGTPSFPFLWPPTVVESPLMSAHPLEFHLPCLLYK